MTQSRTRYFKFISVQGISSIKHDLARSGFQFWLKIGDQWSVVAPLWFWKFWEKILDFGIFFQNFEFFENFENYEL